MSKKEYATIYVAVKLCNRTNYQLQTFTDYIFLMITDYIFLPITDYIFLPITDYKLLPITDYKLLLWSVNFGYSIGINAIFCNV
jgi:hypothetical protein